ncbi:phage minor capsid protein [Lapidilactobacillus mulanensis]|uniref:Phage minor capsid protein n=1 Tax=Lapidilactobacillus mulanensis TaxID=2485999 RepID=A0ABW4DR14_9LACO|nr:phage minor capsid protein [Lapidilactobacillus mulanensis]
MVKLTADPHQLTMSSAQIQDIYSGLEQDIFKAFVDRLKTKGLTGDNVQQWQMQKLNELHLVNKDTIKLVSEASGQSEKQLNKLFIDGGVAIYNDEIANIDSGISGKVVENNQIDQVLEGYLDQTRLDLDNNVNQTLLTTNFGDSPVAKTYQQIIKETTADVLSGLKTPDRALADTIYKWRNRGITPVMIDKGGHQWSLEGYARTVIDTTTNRAFQVVRDTAASDNGIDTFVMSSHAACRPACAPIQGKLVTTRREGFKAEGEWFEPLDNHGYGEPGGTFGINCSHIKWSYIPGANTNDQEQFNPKESVEKYKWQQKQRALERKVRESKRNEELADQLGDEDGKAKFGLQKLKYQSALRKIVDDHDFLVRDYNRENSFGLSATKRLVKKSAPVAKQSVISKDYK